MTKDPYEDVIKKIDVKGRQSAEMPTPKSLWSTTTTSNARSVPAFIRLCSRQLLKEYGDRVAFIYKDFPLSEIHPWAIHAAVDANCIAATNSDAYWDFADYIHSNQATVNKEANKDSQFAALDHMTLTEATNSNWTRPSWPILRQGTRRVTQSLHR